jgi:hypothetical protein
MSTFSGRRLAVGLLAVSGLLASAMGSATAQGEGATASAAAVRFGTGSTLPIGSLPISGLPISVPISGLPISGLGDLGSMGAVSASGNSTEQVNRVLNVALPTVNPVLEISLGKATADTDLVSTTEDVTAHKAAASASLASLAITPSRLLANQLVNQILAQGRAQLQSLRQQLEAQQAILSTINVLAGLTGELTLTSPVGVIHLDGGHTANLQQIAQQIVGSAPEVDPVALADELTGGLTDQLTAIIADRLDLNIEALRTECTLDAVAGTATGKTEILFSQGTWSTLQAFNPQTLGQLPVTLNQGGNVSVQVPPNTTVDLGGIVKLVLNEQTTSSGNGTASYKVNGAHVSVAGVADVALASSNCELTGTELVVPAVPENDVLGVYVPNLNPHLDVDMNGGGSGGTGGAFGLDLDGGITPSGPLGIKAGPLDLSFALPPLGGVGNLGGLLQLSGLALP